MEKRTDSNYIRPWLVLVQDCALSILASLFSILLCRWLSEATPGFTSMVFMWLELSAAASLISIFFTGTHKVVRRWSTVKTSSRLLLMILLKVLFLSVAVVFGLIKMGEPALNVLLILSDFLFTAFCLFYARFAATVFGKTEVGDITSVVSRKNALVYGTGEDSIRLANAITSKREYNVVGFLTFDKTLAGRVIGNRTVYYCTSHNDIQALEWKLGGVDCVFFANAQYDLGDLDEDEMEMAHSTVSKLDLRSRIDQITKRSFDVVLSSILLVVFSPLAAIIALAIYIEDGQSVLYKQERVGLYGESFNILKFRSMKMDAEAYGAQLFSGDSDPRLTKVGRFIRAHHLDELPQIWNVLRGDMSFVGYRPERPFYISKIMRENPRYRYLYQIRPGVTSYATLYNGYTDTMEKMLKRLDLDLYYLRHHSVAFDMKVLGLTFLSIVSGKKF